MAQNGKLKIALEDRIDALQLVREEMYEVTGITAEPEFQEIDRPGELLIEVRLRDAEEYSPTEVAKMVSSEAQHFQVLSAWTEPSKPVLRRAVQCQVVDLFDCDVPDLALRAHRDGLPTARWCHPSPAQTPHWLLAVPGINADRKAVVGICRRAGHYYRFAASEATSLVSSAFA